MHATRLESQLSTCRGLTAKQIAYHLTPLPMPYFELMISMINIFIVTMGWNSAVRLVSDTPLFAEPVIPNPDRPWDIATECTGFLIVIMAFNTMRHIAEDLTDPFGNDATDYMLDFDLKNLWEESQETIANMKKTASGGDQASRMIKAAKQRMKEEEEGASATPLAMKVAKGIGSIKELL